MNLPGHAVDDDSRDVVSLLFLSYRSSDEKSPFRSRCRSYMKNGTLWLPVMAVGLPSMVAMFMVMVIAATTD